MGECIEEPNENRWKITLNTPTSIKPSSKSFSEVNSRIIWVDFQNLKRPYGDNRGEEDLIKLLVKLNEEKKMERSATTATLLHQWQLVLLKREGNVTECWSENGRYTIRNLSKATSGSHEGIISH